MSRLTLSSTYNSSERNVFTESLCLEFIIAIDQIGFDSFSKDSRAKAAATKTRCHVELTSRILNKKVSSSRWAKYAIVRVTGPDRASLDQCLRLLERQFPVFLHRKDYTRRANVTLYTKDVLHPDNIPGVSKAIRSSSTMSCCQGLLVKSPFSNDEVRPLKNTAWKLGRSELDGYYTPSLLKTLEGQTPLEETYSRLGNMQSNKYSRNEVFGAIWYTGDKDVITEKTSETKHSNGNESPLTNHTHPNTKESKMSVKYLSNKGNINIDVKSAKTSSAIGNDTKESSGTKGILKYGKISYVDNNTKDSSGKIKFSEESPFRNASPEYIDTGSVKNLGSQTSFHKTNTVNDDLSVKVTDKDGHFDVEVLSSHSSTESLHYPEEIKLNTIPDHFKAGAFKENDITRHQLSVKKRKENTDSNLQRESNIDVNFSKTSCKKLLHDSKNMIKYLNEPLLKNAQMNRVVARRSTKPNIIVKASKTSSVGSSHEELSISVSDGDLDIEIHRSRTLSKDDSIHNLNRYTESGYGSMDKSKNSKGISGNTESDIANKKLQYGKESNLSTLSHSSHTLDALGNVVCPRYMRHQAHMAKMNKLTKSNEKVRSHIPKSVNQRPMKYHNDENEGSRRSPYEGRSSTSDNRRTHSGLGKDDGTRRSFNDDDYSRDAMSLKSILHNRDNDSVKGSQNEFFNIEYPPSLTIKISTHIDSSKTDRSSSQSSSVTISSIAIIYKNSHSPIESFESNISERRNPSISLTSSKSENSSISIKCTVTHAPEKKCVEKPYGTCQILIKFPYNSEIRSSSVREGSHTTLSTTSTLVRDPPQTFAIPKLGEFQISINKTAAKLSINIHKNDGLSNEETQSSISTKEEYHQKEESPKVEHLRKETADKETSTFSIKITSTEGKDDVFKDNSDIVPKATTDANDFKKISSFPSKKEASIFSIIISKIDNSQQTVELPKVEDLTDLPKTTVDKGTSTLSINITKYGGYEDTNELKAKEMSNKKNDDLEPLTKAPTDRETSILTVNFAKIEGKNSLSKQSDVNGLSAKNEPKQEEDSPNFRSSEVVPKETADGNSIKKASSFSDKETSTLSVSIKRKREKEGLSKEVSTEDMLKHKVSQNSEIVPKDFADEGRTKKVPSSDKETSTISINIERKRGLSKEVNTEDGLKHKIDRPQSQISEIVPNAIVDANSIMKVSSLSSESLSIVITKIDGKKSSSKNAGTNEISTKDMSPQNLNYPNEQSFETLPKATIDRETSTLSINITRKEGNEDGNAFPNKAMSIEKVDSPKKEDLEYLPKATVDRETSTLSITITKKDENDGISKESDVNRFLVEDDLKDEDDILELQGTEIVPKTTSQATSIKKEPSFSSESLSIEITKIYGKQSLSKNSGAKEISQHTADPSKGKVSEHSPKVTTDRETSTISINITKKEGNDDVNSSSAKDLTKYKVDLPKLRDSEIMSKTIADANNIKKVSSFSSESLSIKITNIDGKESLSKNKEPNREMSLQNEEPQKVQDMEQSPKATMDREISTLSIKITKIEGNDDGNAFFNKNVSKQIEETPKPQSSEIVPRISTSQNSIKKVSSFSSEALSIKIIKIDGKESLPKNAGISAISNHDMSLQELDFPNKEYSPTSAIDRETSTFSINVTKLVGNDDKNSFKLNESPLKVPSSEIVTKEITGANSVKRKSSSSEKESSTLSISIKRKKVKKGSSKESNTKEVSKHNLNSPKMPSLDLVPKVDAEADADGTKKKSSFSSEKETSMFSIKITRLDGNKSLSQNLGTNADAMKEISPQSIDSPKAQNSEHLPKATTDRETSTLSIKFTKIEGNEDPVAFSPNNVSKEKEEIPKLRSSEVLSEAFNDGNMIKKLSSSSDKETSTISITIKRKKVKDGLPNDDNAKDVSKHKVGTAKVKKSEILPKNLEDRNSVQKVPSNIDGRETSSLLINVQNIKDTKGLSKEAGSNTVGTKDNSHQKVNTNDEKRSAIVKTQSIEEYDPEPIPSALEINKSNTSSEGFFHMSERQGNEIKFKIEDNDNSISKMSLIISEANIMGKSEKQDSLRKENLFGNIKRVLGIKVDIVHSQSCLENPQGVYLKGLYNSTNISKRINSNIGNNNEFDNANYISSKLDNCTGGILILMFEGLNIFSIGSKSKVIRPTEDDPGHGAYNFESSHYIIKTESQKYVKHRQLSNRSQE